METVLGNVNNAAGYGPAPTNTIRNLRSLPYDRPDVNQFVAGNVRPEGMANVFASGPGAVEGLGNALEMFQQNNQGASMGEYQQMILAMQNAGALGLSGQTEPCQFFQKAGWCKFGDACRYAHVGAPRQAEVCQFFQRAGWCKWADACRHIHPGAPTAGSGRPPLISQPPVCKFFQLPGGCRLGESCRFMHTGTPGQPEVCNFFQRVGWCKFGDTCKYIHSINPAATPSTAPGGAPATAPATAGFGAMGVYGQSDFQGSAYSQPEFQGNTYGQQEFPGFAGAGMVAPLGIGGVPALDAGAGGLTPTTNDGSALAAALAGFAKAISAVSPTAGTS